MTDAQKKLLEAVGGTVEDTQPKDPIAELTAKIDALIEYQGLTGRWNGNVFVVEKPEMASGDYTNPIHIPAEGITVEAGKWYYVDDPDLPHEALQDAFVTPEDFNDRTWFDFVE